MDMLDFPCPWCGESNEIALDPGELGQQVLTDCRVCCRPIEIDLPDAPGGDPIVRGEGR